MQMPMVAIEARNIPSPKMLPAWTAVRHEDLDFNELCRELGVEPTSSFLDRFNFDAPSEEDESTWYSPTTARSTFAAIRMHLEQNPQLLPEVLNADSKIFRKDLLDELRECEDLFKNLEAADDVFHLVIIVFMPGEGDA